MAEAEEQLAEVSDVNKSLQVQLNQSHMRTAEDHNLSLKVVEAEDEVDRLKRAIGETDRRAQVRE